MNKRMLTFSLLGSAAVYGALALRITSDERATMQLIDPVNQASAETSGTRLKAKYLSAADGAHLFEPEIMHDSQLGVDCTFRLAADGAFRCLPVVTPASGSGWGVIVFTDASCKNGLVWVEPPQAGCPTTVPTHAERHTDPPHCTPVAGLEDLLAHIHPVGNLLPPQSGPFYRIDGDGSCVTGGLASSRGIPYAIGAEIPATDFAEGVRGIDP